jgi:hypothetical protein
MQSSPNAESDAALAGLHSGYLRMKQRGKFFGACEDSFLAHQRAVHLRTERGGTQVFHGADGPGRNAKEHWRERQRLDRQAHRI